MYALIFLADILEIQVIPLTVGVLCVSVFKI